MNINVLKMDERLNQRNLLSKKKSKKFMKHDLCSGLDICLGPNPMLYPSAQYHKYWSILFEKFLSHPHIYFSPNIAKYFSSVNFRKIYTKKFRKRFLNFFR
jgi:hypothetical protein